MGEIHPNHSEPTDEFFVIDTVRGNVHSTTDKITEAFDRAVDAGPYYVVTQFIEPPEGAE